MTTQSVSPEKPHFTCSIRAAVCLGSVLFAPALLAQDAATEEAAESSQSFLDLLVLGGWAMIPLGLCSIALVFLAVFNFIQLTKSKFCPGELEASLMDSMRNCMVRSTIEVASTSPTYLGRMMAYSLPAIDATKTDDLGRTSVEDKMADFTMKENRSYMNSITYLSIIAQVAPMLGLLGTVSGMISAFGVLASTGGTDPQKLSGSISEALITTAAGLAIAIPALALYFFFRNKLSSLVSDCHSSGEEMMDVAVASVHGDELLAKVPEGLSVH